MTSRLLRATLLGMFLSILVILAWMPVAAGDLDPWNPDDAVALKASWLAASKSTGAIETSNVLTDAVALYLPTIKVPGTPGSPFNIHEKASVISLYNSAYKAAPASPMGWTGNLSTCDAGSTSQAYRDSLQRLVNFFRTMAGVPANITFSDEYNAKAQQAALMMSANGELNHFPPATWLCYSADGYAAAGSSNLSLWWGMDPDYHGIKGQMEDDDPYNQAVGHRRWILCPATKVMGTGDVPQSGDYMAANALWVLDGSWQDPRPAVRDDFVAWPPSGYVPSTLVYRRWSFMFRDADFDAAAVSVRFRGRTLPVQMETQTTGICENALVWVPEIPWDSLDPAQDNVFTVQILGVLIDGETRDFTYDVSVFLSD